MTYRRVKGLELPRPLSNADVGAVLFWESKKNKEIVFSCPCGEREVYVIDPPHGISFDADERLTIEGSCGLRARPSIGRPANWCHFFIRGGEYEMCGDSQCPGKELI